MLAALALTSFGLVAAEPSSSPAAAPPSLPPSLPTLDDRLLEPPSPALTPLAAARLRGVVDDGVVDGIDGDDRVGAGWTGRVGIAGQLGVAAGAVVVGAQGWWLGDAGPAQPGPALSTSPAVPALLHATLSVPLLLVGQPARLVVGRLTPVIADGRWWGAEPFDARGRTSDGAVVDVDIAGAGDDVAWTLSSGLFARTEAGGAPAGFAALARRGGNVDVDVYALGDRVVDGVDVVDVVTRAATRSLVGGRVLVETGPVQVRAGVDGLAVVDDATTTTRPAGHAELAFSTRLPWRATSPRPFVDVGAEATGGPARWGTPAPTVHGTMGALDLVDVDNTWQLRAAAGVTGTGDEDGFDVVVGWRHIARLTDLRPLSQPGGGAVAFDHLDEVDVDVAVPVDDGAALQFSWSGAPLASGVAQRLLVSLTYAIGDRGDDPPPFQHGPAALAPVVIPGERAPR